jgi:CDP-diacylglycerol--glycerol-3-phosphate 3-phosphatidyltransferase
MSPESDSPPTRARASSPAESLSVPSPSASVPSASPEVPEAEIVAALGPDQPLEAAALCPDQRPAAADESEAEALRIEVTPLPGAPPLLNAANLLTLLRLALVPVFIGFLLTHDGQHTGWRLAATAVFAVAALTDRFDGQIARRRGLVTRFGTVADPIADKALMGAALIGLSALGELSWWVTIVIAVRELGVTALRFWVLRHGVIAASRGGKLKTLVQSLAIGLYVLPLTALGPDSVVDWTRWWLMALAVALTVITGADYVLRALRLRASGLAAARAITRAG